MFSGGLVSNLDWGLALPWDDESLGRGLALPWDVESLGGGLALPWDVKSLGEGLALQGALSLCKGLVVLWKLFRVEVNIKKYRA